MKRTLLGALLGFAAMCAPAPVAADDCGTPSDCSETAGFLTAVGVTGGAVAVIAGLLGGSIGGTAPPTAPGGGPTGGPFRGGPRLVDPDTKEPLLVHDGTYEDGKPGQVWWPWEGWVDPDVAAELQREHEQQLGDRQREIDGFNAETERGAREREAAADAEAASTQRSQAEAAARRAELAELRRRGQGLIDRLDDPVQAQALQDFLDQNADDPDALGRAVQQVRDQTWGREQQQSTAEAQEALRDADRYGQLEEAASFVEAAARAGIAATGGAAIAAGAATASAVAAAAAMTGAVAGSGAATESYQRGDSFVQGSANAAAAAAIGAMEGAVSVGAQAGGLSTSGRVLVRATGSGVADFADHVRRTGDVEGAVVQGAIGVVFSGIDPAFSGPGAGTAAAEMAASALEGGLRSRAQGGSFAEGARSGATSYAAGRAGGAAAGRAAGRASGTGFTPRPDADAPGPRPSDPAPDEPEGVRPETEEPASRPPPAEPPASPSPHETLAQRQRDLAAADQRLRDAEARLRETPEDSDGYLDAYWDRQEAQGDKTAAERAEIEATIRAGEAEDAAGAPRPPEDPAAPTVRPDDDGEPGAAGDEPHEIGAPNAVGAFDLGADAAADPLAEYATGELPQGFIPQVQAKDCAVACFTHATNGDYEATLDKLRPHLTEEVNPLTGETELKGLLPRNLDAAMQDLGIAGPSFREVGASGNLGARLNRNDRAMVAIYKPDAEGRPTPGTGHVVTFERSFSVDGVPHVQFYDPARGRLQMSLADAKRLSASFRHARFIEPGGGGGAG